MNDTLKRRGVRLAASWCLPAAAALAAVMFFLPRVLLNIGTFDEGFIASGAMMILRGDVPIRDFFVIYGPGQYYLSAALLALGGENLLVTRGAHIVLMALLSSLIASTSLRLSGDRARLVFWPVLVFLLMSFVKMPNPGYPVVPAAMLLMLSAGNFSRWVATGERRQLLVLSLLVGCVGLLRWDFAILGFAAHTVGLLVMARAKGARWRDWAKAMACMISPGAGLIVLGFLPFVWTGDALRWFREVPLFALTEFKHWRNLDMVVPSLLDLTEALASRKFGVVFQAGLRLFYAVIPFVLAPTAICVALQRIWRHKGTAPAMTDVLAFSLGLLTLALLNQVRVRAAGAQAYPGFAMALPLIAYLLAAVPSRSRVSNAPVWRFKTGSAVLVAAVALAIAPVWQRIAAVVAVQQDIARAGPVLTTPESKATTAAYAELVQYVQATTQADEFIFSGVLDNSRLHSNDAMLYFLTGRRSATRWLEMEPGLTNTPAAQQEIVQELTAKRVNTVVLVPNESTEPNATAYSNGVHILDEYIERNFRKVREFGTYIVLKRIADRP